MLGLTFVSKWLFLVFLLFGFSASGVSANQNGGYQFFRTRPDLTPPVLNTTILKEGVTPGYVFIAPHHIHRSSAAIFRNDGRLIWTSLGSMIGGNMHLFRVCKYKGADHLCFFRGETWAGFYIGDVHIYSKELVPVATIKAQNGRAGCDLHENNLVDDGKAMLVDIYNVERYDLSDWGITTGEGWIRNGMFQKIDVETGELLFEWSALDNIPLAESMVPLGQTVGAAGGHGLDVGGSWDYLHLNSIDENADGDFLLSGRHTCALYKISGEDGRILWRLGGKASDFELGENVTFGYQHHARWHFSNATTDIISFFDNAYDGHHQTAHSSSAKIIKLDHTTTPPRASLLSHFLPTPGQGFSATQGNIQILGGPDADPLNSNVLVGWGSQPVVTEHLPTGEIVFKATVTTPGANIYRAYRFNFTSNPYDAPALYTYAQSTEPTASTVFYMSWNGATEVTHWHIYGRQSCGEEWTDLGIGEHDAFESNYTAVGYWAYGMVEALDSEYNPLRRSIENGIKTFVPSPILATSCDVEGCNATNQRKPTDSELPVTTRGGCPFTPKKPTPGVKSTIEKLGLNRRVDFPIGGVLVFALLLICLVLTAAAFTCCTGALRSVSSRHRHMPLPQSDPEFEPVESISLRSGKTMSHP